MTKISDNLLKFDIGIEEIFSTSELEDAHLPEEATFYPTTDTDIPSLEHRLLSRNIKSYILKELKPRIVNKDILIPSRYRSLIHESLEIFDSLSHQEKDEIFSKARSLFEEETNLLSLLSIFTNLLIKG